LKPTPEHPETLIPPEATKTKEGIDEGDEEDEAKDEDDEARGEDDEDDD
jgi:hypothetical protein